MQTFLDSNNKAYTWIDGDTFINEEGDSFRVNNFNAREVDRFYEEDGELKYKGGSTLGPTQSETIASIQAKGGFNTIIDTGEEDEYGRKLVSLVNDRGEYLDRVLTASGITEVGKNTTPEARMAKHEMGWLKDSHGLQVDPYSQESKRVNDQLIEEGLAYKGVAINEADFNPDIHYGVAHRDHERTLTNEAKGFSNQIGESWGKGWDGLKEGFWGYLNAIGEVTDSEMLSNLGHQGVLNAKFRMEDAPKTLNNYKDIESIWDGFQWATNNAVMSAPYLIGIFGSFAAAIPMTAVLGPVGGLMTAYAPISMIYAGQTWNEMEGEKGLPQFLAATTAGIAAATLDRLGMQALMPSTQLLTTSGLNRLVVEYAKKSNPILFKKDRKSAIALSKLVVGNTIKEQKNQLMRGLMRLSPDDIAKFSGANLAKNAAMGAVGEGTTEILQESAQMYAAEKFSEKEYDPDEIKDRLMNAGLAGSILGGSIGTATNSFTQMKNQIVGASLLNHDINRLRPIEQSKVKAIKNNETIKTVDELTEETANEKLKRKVQNDANTNGIFTSAGATWEQLNRGIKNFFKNNDNVNDYVDASLRGLGRLVNAAEKSAIDMKKLVQSDTAKKIFALIGQVTTGVYHSGKNFKQYQDSLVSNFKLHVDESYIAESFGYKSLNSSRAKRISKEVIEFGRSGDFNKWSKGQDFDKSKYTLDVEKLGETAKQFKEGYEAIYREMNKEWGKENRTGKNNPLSWDEDYWWKALGFDYKKVRRDPNGFKEWLRKNFDQAKDPDSGEDWVQKTFENIAYRGENSFGRDFSAVAGSPMTTTSFSRTMLDSVNTKGFNPTFDDKGKKIHDGWNSENIFESLNRTQVEGAKYSASMKYFGEGGWKLDKLFKDLKEEEALKTGPNVMTEEDINQFAFYTKAIIDSTHGNFNRIENPKLAALNRYLTSLSIFAGLPLSAISSIPETAMIYFNLNKDSEYKTATDKLIKNIAGAWDNAAAAEVKKMAQSLDRSGLTYAQNAVVDRLATGERDIQFLRLHESFFKLIGIKQITQFQRRMNAGFAVDYIRGALLDLDTAPKKKVKGEEVFDIDNFNEFEMKSFMSLNDLGINPEQLYALVEDLDQEMRSAILDITDTKDYTGMTDESLVKDPTPRQAALTKLALIESRKNRDPNVVSLSQRISSLQSMINEEVETGIYRFVNERIQNPQAANRPLFFQDPHFQLMTQFNGFISTFTANIVPKLWNRGMMKGTKQMKYDTFVLIATMLALGGASQYLKDLIKFGESSPYLDGWGYTQRAIYASGIIGQYERVADIVYPLYPDRDDGLEWLFNTALGEAGPSARLVSNAIGSGKDFIEGETERGISNALKVAPFVSVLPEFRKGIARGMTGEKVFQDKEFTGSEWEDKPNKSVTEFLLG